MLTALYLKKKKKKNFVLKQVSLVKKEGLSNLYDIHLFERIHVLTYSYGYFVYQVDATSFTLGVTH